MRKTQPHISLFRRLVPLMLVLALLGGGGSSLLLIHNFEREVSRFQTEVIQQQTEIFGQRIRLKIEDAVTNAFRLSQSQVVLQLAAADLFADPLGPSAQRVADLLRAVLRRSQEFVEVELLTATPRGLWRLRAERQGQSDIAVQSESYQPVASEPSASTALDQAQQVRVMIAPAEPGGGNPIPWLQIKIPLVSSFVTDAADERGHIMLRGPLETILTETSARLLGSATVFVITPADGQLYVLPSPGWKEDLSVARRVLESTESGGQSMEGVALVDLDERQGYGGWRLGVIDRGGSREQVINSALRSNLVIQLGMILLFFLLALLAAKSVSRPIERLRQSLARKGERVSAEDLPPQADADLHALFEVILNNASRLQRMERDRNELVKVLAHDLREPLLTINTLSDVMPSMLAEGSYDDLEASLGFMRQATDRGNALLERMRRYFALGSAQPELVRLHEVVNSCGAAILDASTIVPPPEIVVNGEATLIARRSDIATLCTNLLENAVQHRLAGEPCRIRCSLASTESGCLLTIEDNGPGVPEEQREKIFQIFARINNRMDPQSYGTGLAECRKVALDHLGSIHAEASVLGGLAIVVQLSSLPEDYSGPD